MNKTAGAKFFILFFLVATFFTFPGNVFAIDEQTATWCTPDRTIFTQVGNAFTALDIRKTVVNMFYAAATDAPFVGVAGMNSTQMMGCAHWLFTTKDGFEGYSELAAKIAECPEARGDATCEQLLQTYDGQVPLDKDKTPAFNNTRVSGSLLGIANYLQGVGFNEPVPVNLAYFWNDSIKDIPFAGSALAADVQYRYAPFISFVLDMWKITRNLSYGVLSIIMLVVGISIMMRKKLSPQAVVTAQYALPRVVLAVILITFSYPIGAILASSMKYLLSLSNGLLYDVAQSAGIGGGGAAVLGGSLGVGTAALLLLAGGLAATGAGAVIVVVTILLIVTAIILYIFVWIKAFMLYIKLIMSIIFAPFAFALGAIPGNEKSTENWLKSALSCVFGYVLTIAYAHMVLVVLFIAISRGFQPASLGSGSTAGSAIIFIFFPVFVVYGFIQAAKVPGKINTLIMGEEKRPGGRK